MVRFSAAILVILFLLPVVARAQVAEDRVPRNPDAEAIFEQGLDAFEQGDYGMAYRRFRLVDALYEFNRKTTAAMLMAGKSLYRDGKNDEAIALLTELIRKYPTSRYVGEAQETIARARGDAAPESVETGVFQLGVILPLKDAALTRALFNGIRLAVDQHNEGERTGPPVRMVFRDTKNDPVTARRAVTELAGTEKAGAILGPLFSDEAVAAAAAAEQAGVVLLAPLATDESVSQGRPHVFQANATMTMRGRQMAQYAVTKLGLRRLGIVGELNDSLSERMAEAFQTEALRLGANVRFYELIQDVRGVNDWFARVSDSTLQSVDAVYLPVSGSNRTAFARTVYTGLTKRHPGIQILGNNEWGADTPPARVTGQGVVFASDYIADTGKEPVQAFSRRYRELTGHDPKGEELRLAITGYDTARFLLRALTSAEGSELAGALRKAPPYAGVGTRINFGGGNVNEMLFFQRYSGSGTSLMD